MHKERIVGPRHVFGIYRPTHVLAQNLSVVFRTSHTRTSPVLRINKVGPFKSFLLIVLHLCSTHEFRIKFIALRMSNHKVHICLIHEIGKRVGYSLRKRTWMRCPCQNHFRTFSTLVFFNRNQISKCLQRMSCSRFHRENRFTGILNKLIQNLLGIIIFPTFKSRERAYTNHITIRSHYRNSLQQMLTLVTIHNHATLCFQFPGTLIHIQHDDIHTQITGSLLRAQTRT